MAMSLFVRFFLCRLKRVLLAAGAYRVGYSDSLSRLPWSWVGGRLLPLYSHQMNRVNSPNGSAMMTAP